MKVKWLSGIFAAAIMLMCSVSFASPFVDDGVLAVAPTIEINSYTENDQPLVLAAKPENSGISDSSTGRISMAYYQLNVDNLITRTVLSCGYQSKQTETPTKIPIAI